MISRSELDVYIDSLRSGVNEFNDGFTGMGGVRVTFDLCSPVIFFSSSTRLMPESFSLPTEKKQENKREGLL